jgi:hypothetical protein
MNFHRTPSSEETCMKARHARAAVTRRFAAGRAISLGAEGTGAPSIGLPGLALIFTLFVLAGLGLTTAAKAALPDGRAYELVSTSGNFGEPYSPSIASNVSRTKVLRSAHPFQASEDGEAITYVGEPGPTGGSGEQGIDQGDQWLAMRTGSGWQTSDITPAASNPFEAFLPDLSTGILNGNGSPPLTPDVRPGCSSLYSRSNESATYRALFAPALEGEECGHPLYAGSTSVGTAIIFQSEAALTENTQVATELPPGHQEHNEWGAQYGRGCRYGCNLYEAIAGGLRPVNVIEGALVPNASFGGYPGEAGQGLSNFSNTISTDGSRIFWTDTEAGPRFEHVYVLENGTNTVEVSGPGAARYWTATPDGHYAYYTEAGALWRFDTQDNTREPLAPEGSGVQAAIGTNQTGEDGAYVYFVASDALAAGATPRVCSPYGAQKKQITEEQEEGLITFPEAFAARERLNAEAAEELNGQIPPRTGCNLYLEHAGQTKFIAALAPEDNEISVQNADFSKTNGGDWKAGLGVRTAEITPDGRHLVFESQRALTGYQNHPAGTNQLQFEVFAYAAEDGDLSCASCDPGGAPPNVVELANGLTRLPVTAASTTYMHRWISDDGDRVFFNSEQRLVPQDTNSVQDVYEWEREGTAGCPVATSRSGGCVFLLSGGETQGYSFLVDADATGDDVFLEHQGPLGEAEVPVGKNALYDARVGGGFPGPADATCVGGGCQAGSPGPASAGASTSSESEGAAGNLPAKSAAQKRRDHLQKALRGCRKKPTRSKRVSCEKQAHRRYGSGDSKKHSAVGKKSDDGRGA